MNHGAQLLAYADRLGGTVEGLGRLLEGPLDLFSGVHILPFFVPFDGADAGFDPIDHRTVDPRLGTWGDVKAISEGGRDVMVDIIVNHASADSEQFTDWLANGDKSQYAGLFLTFDRVFSDGATEEAINAFYRPRPGLPFTPYRMGDGSRRLVWTTFMPSQVDIDVRHPTGIRYIADILDKMAASGVTIVRVDAVGYAIKTPGTDSFMTPETLEFVGELTQMCHERGLEVLVEVHAHHKQQQAVARVADYVYDFATPALILHAFASGDSGPLFSWIGARPTNTLTVLDTHDGIGIIDAGPSVDEEGLITEHDMAAIFDWAATNTEGQSTDASVVPQWASMPHQINSTFYDVLGRDDTRYLLARAVQMFLPGVPQIYYVGLLAGHNDTEAWRRTGEGREVNRHAYSSQEIAQALEQPVVEALLGLIALRAYEPAFEGTFAADRLPNGTLVLTWKKLDRRVALQADFQAPVLRIELENERGHRVLDSMQSLIGFGGELNRQGSMD